MNPFELNAKEIRKLLEKAHVPLPELSKFQSNLGELKDSKQMAIIWGTSKKFRENLGNIPELPKSSYNTFEETGDRKTYEEPYSIRRNQLSVATLFYLLGQKDLKEIIEKYLLAICDEFIWVVPAHQGRLIDIYSSETGLVLADVLNCLGDNLSEDIKIKVYETVNERILKPYLEKTPEHAWYQKADNWNSVCNSQIACTFILIEKDLDRKAKAIETALKGLEVYIADGFNNDGSTSEGVNYWHYGITWFVTFSEMLNSTTNGNVNLLALDKVKKIASFPSSMQLSKEVFASFSDSSEMGLNFHPGIIQRLYERTNQKSLLNLIPKEVKPNSHSITSLLRFILWWNGNSKSKYLPKNITLLDLGVVKLNLKTKDNTNVCLIVKAGNNGENHNHNDIGSFILNIDGENLLTDPGPGLYDKDYFSEKRYENIFANSYGHSVPKIHNQLQGTGAEYFGTVTSLKTDNEVKKVIIDFTHAYNISTLLKVTRTFLLDDEKLILEDSFEFREKPLDIEEAFLTWKNVEQQGKSISIKGENTSISLTSGEDLNFKVEHLEKESEENKKTEILKRITLKTNSSGNTSSNLKFTVKYL